MNQHDIDLMVLELGPRRTQEILAITGIETPGEALMRDHGIDLGLASTSPVAVGDTVSALRGAGEVDGGPGGWSSYFRRRAHR